MSKSITVDVIFATAQAYWVERVTIAAHSTVGDAIKASGMLSRFPEIDLRVNKVGIFGELVLLDHEVLQNDRIEIYRPLLHDPKALRLKRAKEQKRMVK